MPLAIDAPSASFRTGGDVDVVMSSSTTVAAQSDIGHTRQSSTVSTVMGIGNANTTAVLAQKHRDLIEAQQDELDKKFVADSM